MAKRTPEEEEQWRDDWWWYVRDWILFSNDILAQCVGCAIGEKKLDVLLKESFFLRLTALTSMTRSEYENREEEGVMDPSVYWLVEHPERVYVPSVLNEADKLTAVETAAFLRAFHAEKWTIGQWEPTGEGPDRWGGIGPRLHYFQPEVVKEIISHFIKIGLTHHEGRAAWDSYEARREESANP